MNSGQLWNVIRRECARLIRTQIADPRCGIVQSVDTVNFRAKVALQPEGTISGWLPIQTNWVGNGWGVVAMPSPGDQVFVTFQEHDRSCGSITGFHFDAQSVPPQGVKSGELWLVHKTGAAIALLNTGNLDLIAGTGGTVNIGMMLNNLKFLATKDIQSIFNNHHHQVTGVQTGGGSVTSGGPSSTISDSAFTSITRAE